MDQKKLVEVRALKKYFPITEGLFKKKAGFLKAVDGVDMYINKGETLGVVGESGCGKTTLGRLILRLLEPTAGEVIYDGKNLSVFSRKQLREYRKRLQIIFQDPYTSLNPRMMVEEIIREPMEVHRLGQPKERKEKVLQLLNEVGLGKWHMRCYPHELSGGERQRVGIARALAVQPEFIVCDEPVSALDVSVRFQVLNLLKSLQLKYNLTYLLISHDISAVMQLSDRISVMYLGKIIETAPAKELHHNPLHPYTAALLDAVPVPDPDLKRKRILLEEDESSCVNLPKGCRFFPRCRHVKNICIEIEPELKEVGNGHFISCHLYN